MIVGEQRFEAAQAPSLAPDAATDMPSYARQIRHRICHIGVGAFHRAHQAVYLHRLREAGLAEGWGICGIGLRAADRPVLDVLRRQNGLYSVWELEGDTRHGSVIGSLMSLIDASADPLAAIDCIADPDTAIVSLTVTEAGYCLGADGRLHRQHPDIEHDLRFPSRPRSAPGLMVRALAKRRALAHGGLTALSCDNLIANGKRLRDAVLDFAAEVDPALATWIEREVSFPCSMVDRITPALSNERRATLAARWGIRDEALLICEPWRQWVIEDHFVAGRPPFERAGAMLSEQVAVFEAMKVGLLNGSHSALSHIGLMLGYEQVHAALGDERIRDWLHGYMGEVAAVLSVPDGVDLGDYRQSLLRRFANAAIEDRLARLAQDTSSKFQQTLLPPLLRCLQNQWPSAHLSLAVALWIFYLARLAGDRTRQHEYLDRDVDALMASASAALIGGDSADFLQAYLPVDASMQTAFHRAVSTFLRILRDSGIDAALMAVRVPGQAGTAR
ncbi:mannitol dehydrogenase family protein [Solimonas marina]|uniref:Mannitol dehydrogenase family protein n=1 Tax=Solimonas marina TaxID=2714601 RepID=A0A969W935_9GAMM|nr:mannitol dehydrogenase family protein [Solimonas marina]NKF22991.1 mannitol dehydrogenase family protein [Solimonas marina]